MSIPSITAPLTLEQQKDICVEFMNSPAGKYARAYNYEELGFSLTSGDLRNIKSVTTVLNMDMDNTLRSRLCRDLKSNMDKYYAVVSDEVKNSRDFPEEAYFNIGWNDSFDDNGEPILRNMDMDEPQPIRVLTSLIPAPKNEATSFLFENQSDYARKHKVEFEDIMVEDATEMN